MSTQSIRNICIIAHVDHGKTTLVDHLLRQAGTFQSHAQVDERIMDSMDLERERGITISAKNASLLYGDTKINIVDTPGHADFGGEVERIMSMVDGSILLVDAAEGPLPQTRFVLQKSLEQGHRIILCVNKVDRGEITGPEMISEVVDKTFDLFVELGASDEQADFPVVYACARKGWCTESLDDVPALVEDSGEASLKPLYELIKSTISAPKIEEDKAFRMLVANLSYSDYVGMLGIGRIVSGTVKRNQQLTRYYERAIEGKSATADVSEAFAEEKMNMQATRLYAFQGLKSTEVDELVAGDIGMVAGCNDIEIGDTLVGDPALPALPRIRVDPPTLRMLFSINTSPLCGQEGEAIQSRKLKDRLLKEVRSNVALRFEETENADQIFMLGRGELQFAILIENLRREGLEFMVGRPVVVFKEEEGEKLEPIEKLVLDLPESASGDVTNLFQQRKGILTSYQQGSGGGESSEARVRLEITIPTRGLLGVRSRYLTLTRGEGLFSSEFLGYEPFKGEIRHRLNGSLVADRSGDCVEYALSSLEDRGVLFVGPGTKVYEGMIIGEHAKDSDLNVNPCKEKKLTNVRSSGSDGLTILSGTKKMSLEESLEWIDEDEWIEVTPENIRLRKRVLAKNQRPVVRGKKG